MCARSLLATVDMHARDGDRRIGLGVIGAGQIVRERHVPGFKRIPGVELVGVVNRSPESSRRAQEEHGFQRIYRHWRELIDDAEVDAVLIATWPYLHAPITLAALNAGKHVLTQARMAMDGAEARAMPAASSRAGPGRAAQCARLLVTGDPGPGAAAALAPSAGPVREQRHGAGSRLRSHGAMARPGGC